MVIDRSNEQACLFDDKSNKNIVLPNACLHYFPHFLSAKESAWLLDQLKQQVRWEQSEITVYGKSMLIPRLNAWYGDKGCGYVYSGTYFEPLTWLPILVSLKQRIDNYVAEYIISQEQSSRACFQGFNSALVNCYRNGQDSVAWHSDDEPELGENPLIASVSLGATRAFHLKHRYNKDIEKCKLLLTDGDLLIMSGTTQRYWQHQVPKTTKSVGERINITFRTIKPRC